MDLLQCEIESFKEDETQTKHILALALISVSWFFNSKEINKTQAKQWGYVAPTKKSKDGSRFFPQYALTTAGTGRFDANGTEIFKKEAVAMTEYAV